MLGGAALATAARDNVSASTARPAIGLRDAVIELIGARANPALDAPSF
jgi:hypothetical protein